jgi:4-aminobutyrate aminotransferase
MAALEFRTADPLTHEGLPVDTAIPSNIGKRLQDKCLDAGLLLLTTSCFDVIRFIPALVVTEEQVDRSLAIFTKALEEVAREG